MVVPITVTFAVTLVALLLPRPVSSLSASPPFSAPAAPVAAALTHAFDVARHSSALPTPMTRPRRGTSALHLSAEPYSAGDDGRMTVDPTKNRHQLRWVSLGMSWIYLAHFSSLYTQLPGLFGRGTGLLPISNRLLHLDGLWALSSLFPTNPELGLEIFAALGIIVSAAQIIRTDGLLRSGPAGVATFGLQWLLWHDLVVSGGRFTAYQMDLLLLDAAPLTILAAAAASTSVASSSSNANPSVASGKLPFGFPPSAVTFGYRWLLSRLYMGAGAVKLLSCDASWRNLSAVHWHLQSQPLPNPVGSAAFVHLPDGVGRGLTLAVLVAEMAAPFLFLSPSQEVRRVAFVLNVFLMVGIAGFGNFGPLQALLIVVGFALLDDLPPPPGTNEVGCAQQQQLVEGLDLKGNSDSIDANNSDLPSTAVTAISVAIAAGAAFWAVFNVGARCGETLAVAPLVYDLIALGAAVAALPFLSGGTANVGAALSSLVILSGSAATMANGLGVPLPFNDAFEAFNIGAVPYGLFAIITGVGGRPVAVIEAAQSLDGPWHYVPLLYQTNDPSASFPLCWPHFPRLDWTLWFVPLGETGGWLFRLLRGISDGDPAVVGLLDGAEFDRTFPTGPPPIVRIVPRKYELDLAGRGWVVTGDNLASHALVTFARDDDLFGEYNVDSSTTPPWPSSPLRPLAGAVRPEFFVWGCLVSTEVTRRVAQNDRTKGTRRNDSGPTKSEL